MPIYSVGKTHSELSSWLIQEWLNDGPPACFLEGFSGVGKTSTARQVVQSSGWNAIIVNMPEASGNQADDLFLDLATELSSIGVDDLATAVTEGKSFDTALPAVLARKVLIVVDEFQRALDDYGKPLRPIMHLLERLANRLRIPGRVLFLTNRIVERSKWSEGHAIRTLKGLYPVDAENLLDRLLDGIGRSQEIPAERRPDVVNWLGGNPRAIHVLVASLERSPLDELIGISPEIWEARDRQVSAELLHKLERELLERTIELLNPETATVLLRLTVHRKPVKREAVYMFLPDGAEFATVRDSLINRFLMEQHSGWLSLNPVVREISLQRLKEKPSELRQAHSRAADYYMRHFRAKNIVGDGKLGGYFVEARYHLVQSQREGELGEIARRFERHLKATFSLVSPVPSQLEELNERIATLSSLLKTPGAKGLEYYLARLYEARHAEGDMRKGLLYAQRATGARAPVDAWVLRLRLEAKVNGPEQALQVAREGIAKVAADKGVFSLYQNTGELLARAGKVEEAIALLKDGIARVPADKNVFSLYQLMGELLARVGKVEEAIALLKDGIAKVPANKGVFALYQRAGELLARAGKGAEAIALLKDGIAKLPTDQGMSLLYPIAGELLARDGKVEDAIALLRDGIAKLPGHNNVFSLYQSAGGLLASAGKGAEAIALLKDGIAKVPANKGVFALYQRAGELLARAGKGAEAIALLKDGIAKLPTDQGVSLLYPIAGEVLARDGKVEDAIALLRDGIAKLPSDNNVFSLYQSAGELLASAGKGAEAIALLKDGIAKLPSDNNVCSLYQSAGELLARAGKVEDAIALLKDGVAKLPADQRVASLYQSAGGLLTRAGRVEDAISLVKDGIAKVPADKNVATLYHSAAILLAQAGKVEGAITLLKDGIAEIPADKNVVTLYQSAAILLAQTSRDEAIALLEDGIQRVPKGAFGHESLIECALLLLIAQQDVRKLDTFLSAIRVLRAEEHAIALGEVVRLMALHHWDDFASAASRQSARFPFYRPLALYEAFGRLTTKNVAAPQNALQRVLDPSRMRDPIDWVATWALLNDGDLGSAKERLSVYLGRVAIDMELNEQFLLQLWDTAPAFGSRVDLAYYFPILPAYLTGLASDVSRVPYGPSVISQIRSDQRCLQATLPAQPLDVPTRNQPLDWPAWMEEVFNPSKNKPRVDLGIVIALEEEFRELAPQIATRSYYNPDVKQYYYLFEHNTATAALAPYRCVVTFMGTMGPTDAGMVGDRLIAEFNPATIVSIGIAGSMDRDVLLGDVVVADHVDEYLASSKAIETKDKRDWDIEFSGNPYKSDPAYVAHAMNLRYAYSGASQNWEDLSKRRLLEWIGSVSAESLMTQRLIGRVPGIHTGHIASGHIVGAAGQFVQWLKEGRDRKFLALEMESVGVLNAAHKRAVSSLIIRGISDYSDERKTKLDEIGRGALRRYAMNNALALLWVFMDLRLINNSN